MPSRALMIQVDLACGHETGTQPGQCPGMVARMVSVDAQRDGARSRDRDPGIQHRLGIRGQCQVRHADGEPDDQPHEPDGRPSRCPRTAQPVTRPDRRGWRSPIHG